MTTAKARAVDDGKSKRETSRKARDAGQIIEVDLTDVR